jgi:hypothetical protein
MLFAAHWAGRRSMNDCWALPGFRSVRPEGNDSPFNQAGPLSFRHNASLTG